MESLPLELSQRVFSHLDLQDVKSIRLVSKGYSRASCRYLRLRVFVFDETENCRRALKIASHPDLSQIVTTVVVDTSHIEAHATYETWLEFMKPLPYIPRWTDFEPRSGRNHDADQAAAALQRARDKFQKALNDAAYTDEDWPKLYQVFQDLANYQADTSTATLLLDTMTTLFSACPMLRNIIITNAFGCRTAMVSDAQRQTFDVFSPFLRRYSNKTISTSRFSFQQILQCLEPSGRTLNSLTVMATLLDKSTDTSNPQILRDLKHLQLVGMGEEELESVMPMLASAIQLETLCFRALGPPTRLAPLLDVVRSSGLKVVKFCNISTTLDVLEKFLLHHEKTLEHMMMLRTELKWRFLPAFPYTRPWMALAGTFAGLFPGLKHLLLTQPMFTSRHGNYVNRENYVVTSTIMQGRSNRPVKMERLPEGLWGDYYT